MLKNEYCHMWMTRDVSINVTDHVLYLNVPFFWMWGILEADFIHGEEAQRVCFPLANSEIMKHLLHRGP